MPEDATASQPAVRPYRPEDWEAVYDICIRTGDAGEDATGKYSRPQLLGDIWAGPYLYLEPELAFVLDNGQRPVGYVLGTASTPDFVRAYREKWMPLFATTYSPENAAPDGPDAALLDFFHHPERMLVAELSDYPAHLHIDILAGWRGAGHGRALMGAFFKAAAAVGASGVMLAVAPANTGAQAFYERLGFNRVEVAGEVGAFFYARRLDEQPPAAGGPTAPPSTG